MQGEVIRKNVRVYILLVVVYILLLAVFAAISISFDISREERRFSDTAYLIQNHLNATAERDLIALNGFAALLAVEGLHSPKKITDYARAILTNHPDLARLDAAQNISSSELESVAAQYKKSGFVDFYPKKKLNVTSKEFIRVKEKPNYYLVTFIEPMNEGAEVMLGLDIVASPDIGATVKRALKTKAVVASPPFRGVQGAQVYSLIKVVDDDREELVAILTCNGQNLLKGLTIPGKDQLSVDIFFGPVSNVTIPEFSLLHQQARAEAGIFKYVFPKLNQTFQFGNKSNQLYSVVIEKQLDSLIIDKKILAFILTGGLALLLLLAGFAQGHHRSEMKRLEEGNKLFYLANFDPLTGLPNRQLFMNRLEQALAVAHRQGLKHAVLFLDLDGFKGVNDYYGHQIGDKVLQRAARIFLRNMREIDTVARLGGDEFVILLQNIEGRPSAYQVAKKIKKAFHTPAKGSSRVLPMIGTSVGIAVFPYDGETANELLNVADQNMYLDKTAARESSSEPMLKPVYSPESRAASGE